MNVPTRLLGPAIKRAFVLTGRRRQSQPDGWIYLPALEHQVAIRRDRWGIPHVEAATRHDLLLAQGFVHAQDRLWQLELHRRAAAGRLAEVVGPAALPTDRLTRTLGFRRIAAPTWDLLSAGARADLEAYAAGINGYLGLELPLPVEFRLLRFAPDPWEPLDSVAHARVIAWSLSSGWAGELARARLIEHLGADLAAGILPRYPEGHPVTLAEGIEFNCFQPNGMLRAAEGPYLPGGPEGAGRGSNAWAIAGSRSSTGRPILCNDMHLPVTTPSLWYHIHLHQQPDGDSAGLHVTGASQPAVPYVLVGHNERIAWGATLSYVDVQDLYVEKLDAARSTYEYEGVQRPVEAYEERIVVRGEPDHIERVVFTHHGPIISDVVAGTGQALSLRSQVLRPDAAFDGFAMLNEAADWNEFVAAVSHISSPSLNLVYADVEGNIGYYVTGRAPVRDRGYGDVPAPGWLAEYEWIGEVPVEEMPHALNPAGGLIVSANHRIVGDDYPHYLGSCWRCGFRAERLHQLLGDRDPITPEECRAFQLDLLSLPGLAVVEALGDLVAEDEAAAVSLTLLRAWDGRLEATSTGGLVYQVFSHELTEAILRPRLSEELRDLLLGSGPDPVLYPVSEFHAQWPATLLRLLRTKDSPWLPAASRKDLLEACLARATAWLRQRFGPDPADWQWGRLHHIHIPHAFTAQPLLDAAFSQGPFPVGGDSETVAQAATVPGEGLERTSVAPSYRQVIDLGHLEASAAMFAPGQSGRLGSTHYGDLISPWLAGDYYPMLWSAEAVEAAAEEILRLQPPPGS